MCRNVEIKGAICFCMIDYMKLSTRISGTLSHLHPANEVEHSSTPWRSSDHLYTAPY
jgi:hypothetical protein